MVNQTHKDMGKYIDISELRGLKFGKLTILDDGEPFIVSGGHKIRQVKCLCDCGKEAVVYLVAIRRGHTHSCGCYKVEMSRKSATKHGFSYHPLRLVWDGMLSRCYNRNSESYKDYGARGISVYIEWRKEPGIFFKWAIANGYKKGLQIERRDNDGNYSPDNCYFATAKEQARNRRNTIRIIYEGECKSLKDWCDLLKLNYRKVMYRLKNHPDESIEYVFKYNYRK